MLHLRVVTARLLHHLVDDKLRVTPHVELLDAKFDGDAEATEEGLVLLHIVGRWEEEGEMKRRPAPVPVFIIDPLKYTVQHLAWICDGGS